MVSRDNVEAAERRLRKAQRKFDSAGEQFGTEEPIHPGDSLMNSQRSIEHATKAVFILVGVQAPTEHSIPLESNESRQLLNAVWANFGKPTAQKAARLVFLCEMYGSTYPVSDYGIELAKGRLESDEFIDEMESDQAYNHAHEALELAKDIISIGRGTLPPQ